MSLAAAIVLAAAAASAQPASSPRLGVTFSQHDLGADWPDALDRLDDLGVTVVRLGAYWSELEPQEGRLDFSSLDAVLDRIETKGRYRVLLTVGMKAPRWPEFYIPGWAEPATHAGKFSRVTRDARLRERALRFVAETVRHVSHYRCIEAWQVENEPLDHAGPKHWIIGPDALAAEAAAIRAADPLRRPLVVNLFSETRRLQNPLDPDRVIEEALDVADILGLDVYATPAVMKLCIGRFLQWDRVQGAPSRYLRMAREKGKEAWIVEEQAEPWSQCGFSPRDLRWLVDTQLDQGYRTIILWGYEYWYRRLKQGDAALWAAVKGEAARFGALREHGALAGRFADGEVPKLGAPPPGD